MPLDIQKSNYSSNCNHYLFIYFFQFDLGSPSYHSWASVSRSMPSASAFRHLSPLPEHSGAGLGPLLPVSNWFQHRHLCSFRYRTDWMLDSLTFWHLKRGTPCRRDNRGIFGFFSYVSYSILLHLRPLRFHLVGGYWDRTQDFCDFVIGSQKL
jgi:hypothetical protein